MQILDLHRTLTRPPGYAQRHCLLVSYRLPGLRHCFAMCHEPAAPLSTQDRSELLAFFIAQAEQLAEDAVGNRQAFLLMHNGSAIAKRPNWHLHVFVVEQRWQKAWIYAILGAKNLVRSVVALVRPGRSRPRMPTRAPRNESAGQAGHAPARTPRSTTP